MRDVEEAIAFTPYQPPAEVTRPWVDSEHQHASATVLGIAGIEQVWSEYLFSGCGFVYERLYGAARLNYGRGTF